MSTRAIIARPTPDGFAGRYHHFDGYPSGLGAYLYEVWNGHFRRDTEAMMKVLCDDHPAGWSNIIDADWSQELGFAEHVSHGQPQCYCHGDRKERGSLLTERTAASVGCEWAYVIEGTTMKVYSSHTASGKMIGAFGMGDSSAIWVFVGKVALDQPEPNWDRYDDETVRQFTKRYFLTAQTTGGSEATYHPDSMNELWQLSEECEFEGWLLPPSLKEREEAMRIAPEWVRIATVEVSEVEREVEAQ